MDPPRWLEKRSLVVAQHATSLALEPEFWDVLEVFAQARGQSLSSLISHIDAGRDGRPLASACRVAALNYATLR
ncbi:MAG: ribbon-helix-helix domain-containing protein [Caulobacteraceae bacterium]